MTTPNTEHGPITNAVARCKEGDATAPTDLERALRPFLDEMIRHVRQRINPQLKPRIDSHAVVNAALHSFLTGIPKGEFPSLANGVEVKKVLYTLITRILSDEVRREKREKRDPSREQPLANNEDPRVVANDPAPDLAGLVEKLADVVRSVHEKAIDIVELSKEGHSIAEIATRLNLGVRTIQVIKQKMWATWKRCGWEEGS